MRAPWPWGNYWEWPDEDAFRSQPPYIEVTPDEPHDEPVLYGPDDQPLPTRPAVAVGFQIPTKETHDECP